MDIRSDIGFEDILFPVTPKFNDGHLDVGDGHRIYFHELGNPNGVPVVLVHGGPGGSLPVGCPFTRHHDPRYFRIIALDQRGCGQSLPHVAADVKKATYKNNPQTLAADFEALRKHLGIDKWHVYGYSWGSCLGTLYASLYPASVLSLTIGGIWMHTAREIDWYFNYMGLFFPEHEEALLKILPPRVPRFDRMAYIYKAITGKDKALALKVAEAQGHYELMTTFFGPPMVTLTKPKTAKARREHRQHMVSLGALECTFMYEHPLADDWYATPAAQKALRSIKDFHIIQGRYDVICPPTMAYELHKLYPHSTLTMVQYAGHATREVNMLQALIKSANRVKYPAAKNARGKKK